MRVEVLGPVRALVGSREVEVPTTKERALLAALALRPGRVVTVGALVAALWADRPPATAQRTLQSHASRLRGRLGAAVIAADRSGLRLMLDRGDTDVAVLERLVVEGSAAARRRDVHAARELFGQAEGLWRGEPLTDWAEGPRRRAQVERLREMFLSAREGRLRADLDLGAPSDVVDELRRLAAEDPLREPLVALLMLGLYRSGAQLEALRAYRSLHNGLASSWGVDPSPDLQRLQWQILRQDPQLDVKPPLPPLVVPAPLTPFVGRDGQADNVAAAIASDRLVTLHGPAGVGKSRLALEAARTVRTRFPDGVWWVDLTVATDGPAVPARLAQTLGVSAPPGMTVQTALVTHLEHRQLLLVCDNCEHVVGSLGTLVLDLLRAAPGLRVLATSRVYLAVPGEARWEVPPLAVPAAEDDQASIAACDAVQLFQQRRGRRVDDPTVNTLPEVGRLCRRLDGLPLAVELAAAHAQQMCIHDLLDELGREQLKSTTQTAQRHSSVAQAIDWSYRELPAEDRRLLDWLSVFPGDFDAQAVQDLAAVMRHHTVGDVRGHLARLVDASLVEAHPIDKAIRYRLLFVVREFAGARLDERGETDAARHAFANHFRQLAVQSGPSLLGRSSGTWVQRLGREWVNLRSAFNWSTKHDPPEHTLDFVRAMGEVVWTVSPDLTADVDALRGVLERAEAAHAADTAWGWQALVTVAYVSGDVPLAVEANNRAEQQFLESGDQAGLACTYWHGGATQLLAVGDLSAADRLLRQGRMVARRAGVAKPEAYCLAHLVQSQCFSGSADDETGRALRAAEQLADPDDIQLQAHLRMDRALMLLATADLPACIAATEDCVTYSRQTSIATYEQAGLLLKGWALLTAGDSEALANALRAARIAVDVGLDMQFGLALQQLARLADSKDEPVRAAQLWGAALARAPLFPAYQGILVPHYSQQALAAQFSDEQARGAELDAAQALALAIG